MLSDLEILAKLQHFGAATGLLDFTYNPLIALWFACQNKECTGKVFCIDTADSSAFVRINHQVMQEDVSRILSPDTDTGSSLPWIWEPIATGDAETRVLIQHSLFVIGRPSIAKDVAREVTIRKEDKKQLRNELETIYAVREESLFRDIYGFASVNQASDLVPSFEHPESYFLFGNRKYQERAYQEAIDNFDRAIHLQPDYTQAYINRGTAKSGLGRHEEAIADYDQAIRLQPDSSQAYINRGTAKSGLGRHEEAIADYDQAIRLDPEHGKAYIHRGDAKGKLGRYEEAVTDLDQAVQRQSNLPFVYSLRGRMKSELGYHEDAIADIDQSLRHAASPHLYVDRGIAKNALGRHEDAIADHEMAIQLWPGYYYAYANRGIAYRDLGQFEKAIADFDEVILHRPDLAEAYANRGGAQADLGRAAEARRDYERALVLAQETGNESLMVDLERQIQELDSTERE